MSPVEIERLLHRLPDWLFALIGAAMAVDGAFGLWLGWRVGQWVMAGLR